jgi:hypothetical protein
VVVTPWPTSQSAAVAKSSKTFCLCSRIPARCQASPSSPPPRRLATAYTPPAATQAAALGLYAGVSGMSKPPYPVRIVGRGRSPAAPIRNMRTSVPSYDR